MTSSATPAAIAVATVCVIDDDATIRRSLKVLIESVALNVSTFSSAHEYLDSFDPAKPGCVVTDLRMPGISGLQLLDRLRSTGSPIPVLIVTGHADVSTAVTAVRAGVFDFLEKPFSASCMIDRVQAAVELDCRRRLALEERQRTAGRLELLSRREKQVMQMLVAGKVIKQISAELNVSRKTVEAHRASIFTKMQVQNIVELIRGVILVQDKAGLLLNSLSTSSEAGLR